MSYKNSIIKGSVKALIFAVASFLITYYNFGPVWNSGWWVIDDHEIVNYLGSDQKININEIIPQMLTKTEVGRPFESTRYRPSYYLLRIIETYFFTTHPQYYLRLRLFISFAFFFTLMTIIYFSLTKLTEYYPPPSNRVDQKIQRWFLMLIAIISATSISVEGYWPDILARNGSGEIYCVVGLCLYVISYYFLWIKDASKNNLLLAMLTLVNTTGLVISCGSKENFLLLLIPSFILLYRLYARKYPRFNIIFTSIGILYALFIGFAVVIALNHTGVDIYGRSVHLHDRFSVLLKWLLHFKPIHLNLLLTLFLGSIHYFSTKKFTRFTKICILVQFCNILFFFTQVVFYNGLFPLNYRYDFPGKLTYAIGWWINLAQLYYHLVYFKKGQLITYVLFPVIILILLITGLPKIKDNNNTSKFCLKNSQLFTSSIDNLVHVAKINSTLPIIILEETPRPEIIGSTQKFLSFYGINNLVNVISYPLTKHDIDKHSLYAGNCMLLYYHDNNSIGTGVDTVETVDPLKCRIKIAFHL
ncbi:MAG: hypothetical protein HQK53_06640 [Oligoflexia bacterium]|nr:hypothetical protein [Oligoflexia bacterium]